MNNFYSRHKKKFLIIAAVSILSVVIFIAPNTAHATVLDILFGGVAKLVGGVGEIIFYFLGKILTLIGKLFDYILSSETLNQFAKAPIVQTGWKITLGIANLFFSLILVIMAFSTILNIGSYGYKSILPKLVVAALLINFSLVIAGVMIDFTQVLTKFFYGKLQSGNTTLSEKLVKALSMEKIINPPGSPASVLKGFNIKPFETTLFGNPFIATSVKGEHGCEGLLVDDEKETDDHYKKCVAFIMPQEKMKKQLEAEANGGKGTILLAAITNLFFGIIVLALAIFVIGAGAILLIIRVVYLWFLLILAPLAWLAYAFPALNSHWNKWWNKFFSQAFFAPAYAMMLYIALQALISGAMFPSLGTAAFNVGFVFNFIIVIGLLMGALLAAQSMGAIGANTAVSIAQGAKSKMQGWGKGAGLYGARKLTAYDTVAPWATKIIGKGVGYVPGLGRAGKSLQGKALAMKEKQTERYKNYEKYLNSLSPDQIKKELDQKTSWGATRYMAAQAARNTGALKEADTGTAKKAMAIYKSFGKVKDLRDLEEERPDAITDDTIQNAAIQRAISNGSYKKWGTKVFSGDDGKKIMETLRTQLPPGDFISAFKSWSSQVKEAAKAAMEASFGDFDTDDLKRRNLYASSTGNIKHAYTDQKTGQLRTNDAAGYVRGMTSMNIGAVNSEVDLQLIGEHITEGQLEAIKGELSGKQKRTIKDSVEWNSKDQKAINFVKSNPGWNV